jgi:DnaK suppressor protein
VPSKKQPSKQIKHKRIEESLEERKLQRLDEIRRDVFTRFREEHGERYEGAMDTGDMSVASLLESVGFKLAGMREEELREIAAAERKIQNGTYGICEECGNIISEERLSAIPFALYCLNCKEKKEKTQSSDNRRSGQ